MAVRHSRRNAPVVAATPNSPAEPKFAWKLDGIDLVRMRIQPGSHRAKVATKRGRKPRAEGGAE